MFWILLFIGMLVLWAVMRAVMRRLLNAPGLVLKKALEEANAGDINAAQNTLKASLERLPPASECIGPTALDRFNVLLLLAGIINKWAPDPQQELELLTECNEIVKRQPLPLPPPGPDRLVNDGYMMQMNRAVAAVRVGQYLIEEEALTAALQAARDPETQGKSLAYLVWSLLRQEDPAKINRAWATVERFDQLSRHHDLAPVNRAQVETGRAVLYLYRDNIAEARTASVRATRIEPTSHIAWALSQILQQQDISASEAIKQILITAKERNTPPRKDQPLSPLPEDFLGESPAGNAGHKKKGTTISDEEIDTLETKAQALDRTGQHKELEALARHKLKRHNRQDKRRAQLLNILGRALMRQGKMEEALRVMGEAIRLAHESNDALLLVLFLDQRAEILCFAHEFPEALRTLEIAERYLRERQMPNRALEARVAHTRGMAYTGCGWWEEAATHLRKAIQTMDFLRQGYFWASTLGEFVNLTLDQASAEGPDPSLLEEALGLLDSAYLQFELADSLSMKLHARIDRLTIQGMLATLHKDTSALMQVRQGFADIMGQYGDGGSESYFAQPGHFGQFLSCSVGLCRIGRVWAGLTTQSWQAVEELDAQLRFLNTALGRQPRVAILWREKARLHICRDRHSLDNPVATALEAANCMEQAMDIFRSLVGQYSDPQVRAGWLRRSNDTLEDLASVAVFALKELQLGLPEVALRMISLAQYLRARSRRDLVRSHQMLPAATDTEIENLQKRIRDLHRWLDRLDANDWWRRESRGRDLGVLKPVHKTDPTVLFNEVSEELRKKYPEYTLLTSPQQVKDELKDRKKNYARLVSASALLQMNLTQLEYEAPFDISLLQARLGADEIVLDYYVGPSKLHVGIIGHDHLDVVALPPTSIRDLRKVAEMLSPEARSAEGASPIKKSLTMGMQQCSAWLFPNSLVTHLTSVGARRLYIVASGPLWRIPFSWLDADGRLALECWEICMVPSARLAGCIANMRFPLRTYAVGHPGKPELLNVNDEVRNVASLLAGQIIFGAEATPQRVLGQVLPNADVIHFACHGTCDPISALTSSLVLEPDEEHGDGRLLLHEFLGAPMKATLVSLAACHTAKSEGPTSFPESLGHVLLGTGAQFVLASLWAAHDEESLLFSTDFYTMLKKVLDPVVAFQQAQIQQWKRLSSSMGSDEYKSFSDYDFARVANFVLLSAIHHTAEHTPRSL